MKVRIKARIKETGEVVHVIKDNPDDKYYVARRKDGMSIIVHNSEIEPLNTACIDWEQRRYEIAKDVLAVSFSTPMNETSILYYVRKFVQVANILIEELKGGEQ